MNLAKAHLENRESAQAIAALTEATKLNPKSAAAYRNLARAQLLATNPDAALAALAKAAGLQPESAATSYLSGIAYVRGAKFADAVKLFEAAVRLDAQTPTLRYQLANAYQSAGLAEKALEQLRETIRLDPQHASAHYKLANLARQAGDPAAFEQHNREFLRLRKLFGDESRTTEALERCAYTAPEAAPFDPPAGPPPISVRFVNATADVFRGTTKRTSLIDVLELDAEGRSVFAVVDETGIALLKMSPVGKFESIAMKIELPQGVRYNAMAVGDFHNDVPAGARYDAKIHAKNDIALIGKSGVRLLKRSGPTAFADVTDAAGLAGAQGDRGSWLDYEHDGDLDLLLVGDAGLSLWQNNGDGRFEEVTAKVSITPTGAAADVVAIDLDSNVAVDVVTARGTQPTLVFENQRAGRFAPMKEPPGPWPPASRILADDLDNDGQPDVVLLADGQATIIRGGSPDRGRIDMPRLSLSDAVLADYDNDGLLDLIAAGRSTDRQDQGVVRCWRNGGKQGTWPEVTSTLGLSDLAVPPVTQLVAADADFDGDTDLLLATEGDGLRWLRNDGGNANAQFKIQLVTIKTNPTGLGTRVEIRTPDFWATRTVTRLPIEIGLGQRKRLDSVQTLWTNGVVDNQIEVEVTEKPLTILEKNVATGSCPFLYAWDGQRWRFVTDLLGNSPVGLSLTREMVLPADPDEIVSIGAESSLVPKDGKFELLVTEEFREVLYLDEAKLIAVDHPPDVEVHPTDKIMFPPFPRSQVWPLGARRPLRAVIADDGAEPTSALADIDNVFAPPGRPLPSPYRGQCHPLNLTLDFGELDVSRPWVLALTGWLQYGDASTNIAISQNASLTIVPPTLYAETSANNWTKLDVVVGMPAGKTKTILCDLTGKLPPGTRRLRLVSTFEVRWDRIALFERLPMDAITIRQADPTSAQLHWWGFADLRSRGAGHPTTPDSQTRSDFPPWRTTLQGWCTKYGQVLPLVTARDDQVAILNAGDALTLQFDAAAFPPTAPDHRRSFFFYSVGWDKDGDHNVLDGDTVEPLPRSAPPATTSDEWQLEYNTRWVRRHAFTDRD